MRKAIALVVMALFATAAYAGVDPAPKQAEGKTTFGAVSVQGLSSTGNIGYIELSGYQAGGTVKQQYYLYMGTGSNAGKLCVASYPTISAYASFPTGNWQSGMDAACTVVGGQS